MSVLLFLIWDSIFNDKRGQKFHKENGSYVVGLLLYTIIIARGFSWSDWWYKTIVCFPLGLLWGSYQKKIQKFLKKHYAKMFVVCCIFFIISYLFPSIVRRFFHLQGNDVWLLNDFLMAISGTLLIGILLYKISISNVVTSFLGEISYEIYLFHGLLMDVLKYVGDITPITHVQQEMYGIAIMVLTIIVATVFHKINTMVIKNLTI